MCSFLNKDYRKTQNPKAILLMLLSSMDWQKPVLWSNMNEYTVHSIQTYRLCLPCRATSLCWIFKISVFFFFLTTAGSNTLTQRSSDRSEISQHFTLSGSWKCGWMQRVKTTKKIVLSKWLLWPNPCRAPAVFELFAWPLYERGLCWTVEPGDTGACVCLCWCWMCLWLQAE